MIRARIIDFLIFLFQALPVIIAQTEYWPYHGNDKGASRFSTLTDINPGNVGQLQVAWQYNYGQGPLPLTSYTGQTAPLMIHDGGSPGRDILVFCTPWDKLVALDPENGVEIWTNEDAVTSTSGGTCRGVAIWTDSLLQPGDTCRVVIYGTNKDLRLMAVDAATGRRCTQFGNEGFVDLSVPGATCGQPSGYCISFRNPPVILGDILVIGGGTSDNVIPDTPKGTVPGFDARTGQELWRFNIIPTDASDSAMSTWWNGTDGVGSGNVWIHMSGDDELGLVFAPTSSATGEHHGTHRPGDNLYCNSVVALNANTGQLAWHQQLVHHDIWDFDLNSQPIVGHITKDGVRQKVVMQFTKQGFLFVLNAANGEPLYQIDELPVPQTTVPGEYTAATQPFPHDEFLRLAPYRINMTRGADLWGATSADLDYCENVMLSNVKRQGVIFDPANTVEGTFWVPADNGGGNYGGFAFDTDREIAVLPVNHYPAIVQLVPPGIPDSERPSWCWDLPRNQRFEYWECHAWNVLDSNRVPCYKPPWARLVALNMTSGQKMWEVPLGYLPGQNPADGYGSRWISGHLLLTRSGLVFTGNGEDQYFRAHDIISGSVLWTSAEPFPAHAAGGPMTYKVNNRQFIVLQAGGHNTKGTPESQRIRSNLLHAFSLPQP